MAARSLGYAKAEVSDTGAEVDDRVKQAGMPQTLLRATDAASGDLPGVRARRTCARPLGLALAVAVLIPWGDDPQRLLQLEQSKLVAKCLIARRAGFQA